MNCAHCGLPAVDPAGGDDQVLCSPRTAGMDCRRLVAVYCHHTPCEHFACLVSVSLRLEREARCGATH